MFRSADIGNCIPTKTPEKGKITSELYYVIIITSSFAKMTPLSSSPSQINSSKKNQLFTLRLFPPQPLPPW